MVHSTLGPCINRLDLSSSCLDKNHPPRRLSDRWIFMLRPYRRRNWLGKQQFGLRIIGFVKDSGWILYFYSYNKTAIIVYRVIDWKVSVNDTQKMKNDWGKNWRRDRIFWLKNWIDIEKFLWYLELRGYFNKNFHRDEVPKKKWQYETNQRWIASGMDTGIPKFSKNFESIAVCIPQEFDENLIRRKGWRWSMWTLH